MRIAVDLDGTIFKTYEFAVKNLKKETGKKYDLKNMAFGDCDKETRKWFDNYFKTEKSIDVPPYEDAIEILQKIQQDDELAFITSRPKNLEEKTLMTMRDMGFWDVFFVPRRKRVDFLKTLGVDLYIDDELETCLKASERGIPTIMMAREWNNKKYFGNKNLIKVYNWESVFYLIDKVAWNKNN